MRKEAYSSLFVEPQGTLGPPKLNEHRRAPPTDPLFDKLGGKVFDSTKCNPRPFAPPLGASCDLGLPTNPTYVRSNQARALDGFAPYVRGVTLSCALAEFRLSARL